MAGVAALLPFAAGATAAAATPARSTSVAPLVTVARRPAVPSGASLVGPVSRSAAVTFGVVLAPRNPSGLASYAADVSNPKSSLFHHFLERGQFARVFGPTAAAIGAVRATLRASGLEVRGLSGDGLVLTVTGSASHVESAFHTSLSRYRLPGGRVAMTATSALRLPAMVASAVQTVVGLDNLVQPQASGILRASLAAHAGHVAARPSAVPHVAGAPTACSAASTAATAFGGLTDSQIANSYGAFGLYRQGDLGAGQTVAVFELEPFSTSDISTFDQCYFGASAAGAMAGRLSVTQVDGGQPSGSGSGEAVLDVEDVSAIAPQANIDVYEAPNTTFGSLDEYAQIVSSDTANVVTSSWGLCEQAVQLGEPGVQQAENVLFEQAAAQGQSMFAAAGDTGSDDCNAFRSAVPPSDQPVLSVDDPASQPYVTAVGGTTIDAASQPPTEHVWNDGAVWGAGGGGISQSWPMPTWQLDATVPGVDSSTAVDAAQSAMGNTFCRGAAPVGGLETACREVPDVSAQADEFTSAVTIYSAMFGNIGPGLAPGWITIGGTSSATPLWAAMLADINASATCAGNPATTSGVGFANPLLYAVASNPPAYAASFNDITAGNNDIYGISSGATFPATTGYDMASGLGSPELTGLSASGTTTPGLAYYLCSMAAAGTRPMVTALSPSAVPTSGNVSVQVTGTNFGSVVSGSFVADVKDVTVGGVQVPATGGFFTVNSPTSLSVLVPPGPLLNPPGTGTDGAGPADVVVTLKDGESSAPGPASTLQYVDTSSGGTVPAVTGVGPYGGNDAGGNTVTIYGSGFTSSPITSVTFGNVAVAAPSIHVVSSYELSVTVPALSAETNCATAASLPPGENATNDVCQVQVQVTNANGPSATSAILPPYEGLLSFDSMGVLPAASGTEEAPAPTEYDYVPTPTITSISTSTGPGQYASETAYPGPSLVTISGSGFNFQTISAVNFGPANQESSQVTYDVVAATGTSLVVAAPPQAVTTEPLAVQASVDSLGGAGNSSPVTYAGIPRVTGLSQQAVPDTGGSQLGVTGAGLSDATFALLTDGYSPFSTATPYQLDVGSDSAASLTTPSQNPAIVDVELCSVSGCGDNPPADELLLYPPGNPAVTSSGPVAGPAHGGTTVVISGDNLGCVTNVSFGSVPAASFSNAQALLDCGSTTAVVVKAPPGVAGTTVPITVKTVESAVTNYGPSTVTKSAEFTYTRSSPSAALATSASATGDVAHVRWQPPASDGGSPVTGYLVTATARGGGNALRVELGAKARSATVGPLQVGTTYKVVVRAVNALGRGLAATAGQVQARRGDHGYLLASGRGALVGFGSLQRLAGNGGAASPEGSVVGVALQPSGTGYWLVTSKGAVYARGGAPSLGGLASRHLAQPIVAVAATPDGRGYWLVSRSGAVFPFGDAHFHGSLPTLVAAHKVAADHNDVVGIAASPKGGYWIATSTGAVFSFGSARFHGSIPRLVAEHRIAANPDDVVGMASPTTGGGYWLVGRDGGVFAFGSARFRGSIPAAVAHHRLASDPMDIVGLAPARLGDGYWLAGANGAVYAFGSAAPEGSGRSGGLGLTGVSAIAG